MSVERALLALVDDERGVGVDYERCGGDGRLGEVPNGGVQHVNQNGGIRR